MPHYQGDIPGNHEAYDVGDPDYRFSTDCLTRGLNHTSGLASRQNDAEPLVEGAYSAGSWAGATGMVALIVRCLLAVVLSHSSSTRLGRC